MTSFPRRIALLGSTGSIGRQTLDVVRCYPEHFRVVALAARSNISLLAQQAKEFSPQMIACFAETTDREIAAREALPNVLLGEPGLLEIATHPDVDIVVAATSGLMGLAPTLAAIKAGKTIALANKETLVMAGHLVMQAAQDAGVSILPVDSEHSAIWQCLQGENKSEIHHIILTASGGPFRKATDDQMRSVTVQQALAHPTWQMGPKITIDSATLMNKGLEVLEARWLFGIPYDRIQVIVHPESIIHSMVEFVDGSLKMQASLPSMHLPIQYALSYPHRFDTSGTGLVRELNLSEVTRLNFEPLDITRFPCFRLSLEAAKQGDTYPSVLVGADEEAVALFLAGKIGFLEIAKLIEDVLQRHQAVSQPDIPAIIEASAWARRTAQEIYETTLQRTIL